MVFNEIVSANTNQINAQSVASEWEATYQIQTIDVFQSALNGLFIKANDTQIAAIEKDPRVEYITANYAVQQAKTEMGSPIHTATSGQPSTEFSMTTDSWAKDQVDQRNFTLNGTYNWALNASNVHVYVIGSGIKASLAEFAGRVSGGTTFVNDGRGTDDCGIGVGTAEASLIGGNTKGIARPQLHPVRIFDCNGSSSMGKVVSAMNWVANNDGAELETVYLGLTHFDYNLGDPIWGFDYGPAKSAVNNLTNRNIMVVGAAGDAGFELDSFFCSYSFPANASNAFVVGGVTDSGTLQSNSNYGACVDLYAPGSEVSVIGLNGQTIPATGTYFPAALTSGTVALFLAANPQATPAQARKRLIETSTRNLVGGVSNGLSDRLLFAPLDAPASLASNGTYMPTNISVNRNCAGNTYTWNRPAGAPSGTNYIYTISTSPVASFGSGVITLPSFNSSLSVVSKLVEVTSTRYVRVVARRNATGFTDSYPLTSDDVATFVDCDQEPPQLP
ncbi:S8 family serine peptidase [Leptospira sp. WS92.C1]